ncbi:MAG: vitamin B12 dependent-methionine synthase activation domain-containing protein, partial [Gemmatimonadota bacterium]
EVMKAAVTRLEDFLERKEGQSKGTVVLATVLGDVHDIGKNLVHTILENNGYTVHNLGKQVPVNTILDQARALEADAIGLSALLVSTSKQMPLCVEELHRRGLEIPVLLGGAAINPTFVRKAAEIGEGGELYPSGVFYCKDAFDGLTVLERLQDPEGRDAFLARWARDVTEASERRRALQATVPDRAPAGLRPPPSGDVEIPAPPFWGTRVLERLPLEELIPLVDRNTLYRLHWGARNAGGETLEALIDQEFEPRFQRFRQQALAGGGFRVRAAYGFFPAGAEGDDLVLFQPGAPGVELARFSFPRQRDREKLCLSDFFLPVNGAGSANRVGGDGAENPSGAGLSPGVGGREDTAPGDVAALQVVTVDGPVLDESAALMEGGAYAEGYFLHGFGVRLAEAGAELLHRRIRRELGISQDRGLRYSWGYGACPDPRQHELVFSLLPCRERLGMELTEAGALVPELSTAALVVHHPQARYFHV